jgi:hypothetical protein
LFQVGEKEAGAEIDEFELFNIGAFCFKLALDLDKNVLSLKI